MQSSLIGKIEKAKYYASEPQRATLNGLSVSFRGDNDTHAVTLHDDHWHCSCDFFADHDDFDSGTVVLSSASSKTAIGVAFLAHRRGRSVIGLTSPSNRERRCNSNRR